MHAMILSDPKFHVVGPELLKATRRGQFPDAYAERYAEVGLNPDEYEAYGNVLDIISRKNGNSCKGVRLGRLAVQVSRGLGLNGRASDDPRRQALVDDLFDLADRHHPSRVCRLKREIPICYVIIAAEFALASGLPLVSDTLAEATHAALKADQQPFSITDVRDTIRALMEHRPITDWLCEEEVARLRPLAHEGFLRFMRSRKRVKWLADIIRSFELVAWLCDRMQTPAKSALLRERLLKLHERGTTVMRPSQ
jgi:hypothetical protein